MRRSYCRGSGPRGLRECGRRDSKAEDDGGEGALAERWMWRLRFWGMARPFLNTVVSNDCYLDSVFWDVRSVRTLGSATDERLQIKGECSAGRLCICCAWAQDERKTWKIFQYS